MNNPTTLTEEEILDSLAPGADDSRRDRAMRQLFQDKNLKNMVFHYILNNGGNADDAWDVFQEVFVIFERAVRLQQFQQGGRLRSYLVGIAHKHWWNVQRKRGLEARRKAEYQPEETSEAPDALWYSEEAVKCLDLAMAQLDERCREALHYWARTKDSDLLSQWLGLDKVQTKKRTYRCRNKLRALFKAHPHCGQLLNF